jgi:hypothetical protein
MSGMLSGALGVTSGWLSLLLSTDAPALPADWLMRLGLTLGWALLLALLGGGLACRQSLPVRRGLAVALALWALLPGPLTPDYWLGLAFHAPSLTAMLLCGWWLQRLLFVPALASTSTPTPTPSASASVPSASTATAAWAVSVAGAWIWLLPAVLLGYVLLLDTFAVLPLQVYGWGFSPLLLLVLLGFSLLPWLLCGAAASATHPARWLLPAAVLLFAATRLPTGNLWDALLDPWLWLLLQGLLIRSLYRRLRG